MEDIHWSPSEKRLARTLFERAVEQEAGELLAAFKARAAAAESLEELWGLRLELERSERELQQKYDYRYSQLLFVFGRLVREERVKESELATLSEEKLAVIRRIVSL